MTTEEKAKAYDEALEKTRTYRDNARIAEDYVAVARYENIFPELRESEDERIRKELLSFIESVQHNYLCATDRRGKWIAYLEKQKELFESGRGLYYYDGEKTTYCGYPAMKENPYDFAMSQQKEQKSRDYCSVRDESDLDGNLKQKDHFRDDTKMVEKQDYSGLNDLERAIHRGFLSAGVENVPAAIIKETANECKRIANENANAEWSEEDEDKLYQVMETLLADKAVALRETPHCKALHEAYDDMLAWLKSLRPVSKESLQSHWKPSEEQMMALADTLEDMPEHYKPKCTLESLKRDLEKLM